MGKAGKNTKHVVLSARRAKGGDAPKKGVVQKQKLTPSTTRPAPGAGTGRPKRRTEGWGKAKEPWGKKDRLYGRITAREWKQSARNAEALKKKGGMRT